MFKVNKQTHDNGYFLEVGEKGKERLNVLNEIINGSSQNFLKNFISDQMTVLELGCGTGEMTVWIAQQVGVSGKVISVDISNEQINLAKILAHDNGITNIDFYATSAYDIDTLGLQNQVDLVFTRFVLTHLVDHINVLGKLKDILKPNTGILVAQELVGANIFSYPESEAVNKFFEIFFNLFSINDKDLDIGKKLVSLYDKIELKVIDYEFHHPFLKTQNEKLQIVRDLQELKKSIMQFNLSNEDTLNQLTHDLMLEAQREDNILSYAPSMIVAGLKGEVSDLQDIMQLNAIGESPDI